MAAGGLTRSMRNNVLAGVLIALFVLTIWQSATAVPTLGAHGILADFDAFYITGQLVLDGRAAEAHDVARMAAIQRELTGQQAFMPWTYPPQFDLLVAPLPLLPRGIAYALFTLSTLALFLWLLARLAGPSFFAVLLAGALPIYINASIGQNAFLTGALIAGFLCLTLRGSRWAGLPLGLLVIKPHLGIGVGLHALLRARWAVLALAVAVAVALGLLATAVLGPQIWAAFGQGVDSARAALSADFYPFVRMTSLYALLYSLGVPAGVAIVAQGALALTACGAVALTLRKGLPLRWTLATACFASTLISPYFYDYDMVLAVVGGALVAGDVLVRTQLSERILLLALSWVAGGWGLIHALGTMGQSLDERAQGLQALVSFGAVAYLILLGLLIWILRRKDPR